MEEPQFDRDGYPTDATLDKIENWNGDIYELFEFVEKCWMYPDRFRIAGRDVECSTGGWSGNESIISALQKNYVVWGTCWMSSHRGGLHRFILPR